MVPASGKVLDNNNDDEGWEIQSLRSCSGRGSSAGTESHTNREGDVERGHDGAQELRETVIKSEESAVYKSRILVGSAILLCATVVTVAVYLIAKRSDQVSFKLEYEGIVRDIKNLVRWEVRYNFALMEQLAASTTIAAGYLNSTFPFHTESKYEISGGYVDGMGGIMSAAFAPLVRGEQIDQWEVYAQENQGWIEQSAYLKKVHPRHRNALNGTIQDHEQDRRRRVLQNEEDPSISPTIYRWDELGQHVPEAHSPGQLLAPLWQVSPANAGAVNANLLADPFISKLYTAMLKANEGVTSAASTGVLSSNFEVGELFDFLFDPDEQHLKKYPHVFIMEPVYSEISENATLVGFFLGITPFGNLLDRLLPDGHDGIIAVLKDDCGNVMSFRLTWGKTLFLGIGDFHEPEFDDYVHIESNIEMYERRFEGLCTHDLYLYPSARMRSMYDTIGPKLYTGLVALAFLVMIGLFVVFDMAITKRQDKTMDTALQHQAVVQSLFPAEMGKRIIQEAQNAKQQDATKQSKGFKLDQLGHVYSDTKESAMATRQLAQLYTDATVMFADLVGFTAWASKHEPTQVFHLLETLYAAFDRIAKRRSVFKVETIGDCYVAVCGLPQLNRRHHVFMARFARDCLLAVRPLLLKLDIELGPETSELGIRIGLNSGPVTAGVLRGDRARFQLFGDTVNTAARMESTGSKNRIHVSKETAALLTADGKGHWVHSRDETVHAKGKGDIQTFWLDIKNDATYSQASSEGGTSPKETEDASEKTREEENKYNRTTLDSKALRLIEWNVQVLLKCLQGIASHRKASGAEPDDVVLMKLAEQHITSKADGSTFLDEVQDCIPFPTNNADHGPDRRPEQRTNNNDSASAAQLDPAVIDQLQLYVTSIAGCYRKNSFHSFEHASHVLIASRGPIAMGSQ